MPRSLGGGATSYAPVEIKEDFASIMARMKDAKPAVQKKHMDLLNERYDLSDRPAQGVTMSRGKAVQEGVRIKLQGGMTWEKLASISPEEIREKDLFPPGFFPLPFPIHPEGGMLFPKFLIDEINKQEGRDLSRPQGCDSAAQGRPVVSSPSGATGVRLGRHVC